MKLQTYFILLLFLYLKVACDAQKITFNLDRLCDGSGKVLEQDYAHQIDLMLLNTIPALSYYVENNQPQNFLKLRECSKIDSILNLGNRSRNKTKAIHSFDILNLNYLRDNSPDEWVDAYIKKITSIQYMINVTTGAIDYNTNFSNDEKKKHKLALVNGVISDLEENFINAHYSCSKFTKEQKEIHNDLIQELSLYDDSMNALVCN